MNFVAHTSLDHLAHTSATHGDTVHAAGNWVLFGFAGLSLLLVAAILVKKAFFTADDSSLQPQDESPQR